MLNHLIKQKRIAMGLSREELAHRAIVARQTIYNVEKTGRANVETLRKLGAVLDIEELKKL
jgi:DNA-binding XRE family transcriptional regulator